MEQTTTVTEKATSGTTTKSVLDKIHRAPKYIGKRVRDWLASQFIPDPDAYFPETHAARHLHLVATLIALPLWLVSVCLIFRSDGRWYWIVFYFFVSITIFYLAAVDITIFGDQDRDVLYHLERYEAWLEDADFWERYYGYKYIPFFPPKAREIFWMFVLGGVFLFSALIIAALFFTLIDHCLGGY